MGKVVSINLRNMEKDKAEQIATAILRPDRIVASPKGEEIMSGKWVLQHGIHKGTITSRDSGDPIECDSREAALVKLHELRRGYDRIGYVIWYATLINPEGDKENLDSNTNYTQ